METISISPESINATTVGGSKTIDITASNFWSSTVISGSDFISRSPTFGDPGVSSRITIGENKTTSVRKGTVRYYLIADTSVYQEVSIVQDALSYIEKDDIKITLPGTGYTFNPIIFDCVNPNNVKINAVVGETSLAITISKIGYKGKTSFDLAGLSRILFNRDEFYNIEQVDNILHKNMRVSFSYTVDSVITEIGSADIGVIWGAKQIAGIGEKVYKELVYFPSYPYTIPVMRDADSKLRMRIDSDNYLNEMDISAGVKYNIPVNHPEANKSITVRIDNTDDILNDQSIYTDEFDHTFRYTYDSTRITVLKVGCEPSGGIYLRWINTLGEWCYFLFRPQSDELKSESSDISFKEIYNTVNPSDPMNTGHTLYHAGTGQSISKSGIRTMNIAAIFLNQDIFDYVSSITLSPIVDLYLGKKNNKDTWVRISVIDSDIIKSKEVLQNIQIEIQLPDTLNQSL